MNTGDSKVLPIPVNPDLVWDYDIPAEGEQSEAFRRWYIARVLTRGKAEDLRAIGLQTIYAYWPLVHLPSEIRRFWQWYFNLLDVRARYGDTHAVPTTGVGRNRSEPFAG